MAKAPKKKQPEPQPEPKEPSALEYIERRLAAAQAAVKERLRPKNYQDLLAYAQQFNELNFDKPSKAEFPDPLSISAQEAFSPYYGSDYERQQAAAAEYAKQFAKPEEKQLIQIDPKYYEELQRQVPVENADLAAHYNITRGKIILPTPVDMANSNLSLTDKTLAKNNYGSKQDLAKTFKEKLGDYYRDIVEHEAGHIADKHVQFVPQKLSAEDKLYNSPNFDYGYMGKEDHLVTGLGKVQRELYAKTGSRIESADQFKQFVLDLAKAENTEEAISGFSEEAKRALRPQIRNAKDVQDYYNKVDAWNKSKSWFKLFSEPEVPKVQLNFLEKSAQLIPALVQTNTRNKSSV